MKWCVAVLGLGLAVLAISESASVKDYSKNWTKENDDPDQEEINDYLDDTYLTLKTSAKSLNLDPMQLPDIDFKVRDEEHRVIKVKSTNQLLTGMSALKRSADGSIVKNPKRLKSYSMAEDPEINGQLSLLSETDPSFNKTCKLFVDINYVSGVAEFGFPENKSESLTVASLSVYPSSYTLALEKGCVEDADVREDLLSKYDGELYEVLSTTIRRSLKEALNKSLKPFDPVKQ